MVRGVWSLKPFLITCLFSSFILPQFFLLTKEDAMLIADQIWYNECKKSENDILFWSEKEGFASLGIGHFIWYPKGSQGPYEEVFPLFIEYLKKQKVLLPLWLQNSRFCPWESREAFLEAKKSDPRMEELKELLLVTIADQLLFMAKRLEQALEQMTNTLTNGERAEIFEKYQILQTSLAGLYALIDYFNFKGSGMVYSEKYQGVGWGLLDVLKDMKKEDEDPVASFVFSAKKLLLQRVVNAPDQEKEKQWLEGWFKRIDSYLYFPGMA